MSSFSEFSVWSFVNVVSVLLISLVLANMLKRRVPFLKKSLIPTSVLGGTFILIISIIYTFSTKGSNPDNCLIFNTEFFNGEGTDTLEYITFHCLALGFIASTFGSNSAKLSKKRAGEVLDSGVTTVSGYLLQAILGMGITMLISLGFPTLYKACGLLLTFGFGQGTGQAMNFGHIYETSIPDATTGLLFEGGKNFGLSIAALGFIASSIGGVIYLNIVRKKKHIDVEEKMEKSMDVGEIQEENEIPMNGGIDKMTIQIAFIFLCYFLDFLLMFGLSKLVPGLSDVLFGFNFLFGVIFATAVKAIVNKLYQKGIIHHIYINKFMMNRISGFFYDLMIVAGVAAIRIDLLGKYWWILLILAVVGAFATFFYNKLIAHKLFPEYEDEQFVTFYGMLTGTASTGMILLRELDPEYKTPAADNLVYQNFPAMVFGVPMMLIAPAAPEHPYIIYGVIIGFFIVMNLILFRRQIFCRHKKKVVEGETSEVDATEIQNVDFEETSSSEEKK